MSQITRRLPLLLPCLAAILALAPAAHANVISGVAYCNISDTDAGNTPAPGTQSSGTECATFTASGLAFYTDGTNGTNNLGSFLNSYGVIIGGVNYLNGFDATSSMDNSFFEFTGIASFNQGETYNAYHDDGTVMNINGVNVVNAPAPIWLTDTQFVFNQASGNYNFDYTYTEQGGVSAYGTDADASPTPEPRSFILLATGGVFFYLMRRSRMFSLARLAS